MSFQRKISVLLTLLCCFSLSGCVYTRFTEMNLDCGKVQCFGDCSKIEGNQILADSSGKKYIRVKVQGYERTSPALGLTTRPIRFLWFRLDGIAYRHSSLSETDNQGTALLEIPESAVTYLTANTVPDKIEMPSDFKLRETDLEKTSVIPLKRQYPAPMLLQQAGAEDKVVNAPYLGERRSFAGYLSLGLLPVSACCDVVGTVVCTTGSAVVMAPGVGCLYLLIKGLGIQTPFFTIPTVDEKAVGQ